jgi:hypothetical protein
MSARFHAPTNSASPNQSWSNLLYLKCKQLQLILNQSHSPTNILVTDHLALTWYRNREMEKCNMILIHALESNQIWGIQHNYSVQETSGT